MAAAALSCLQAVAAIAAGAVPARADFVEAACPADAPGLLRYDPQARAMRALRDIQAGETIAAVPAGALPDVRPGESLFLVAHVGTAIVEREVTATQPGRRGQPIFVRTADGRVLRARVAEGE